MRHANNLSSILGNSVGLHGDRTFLVDERAISYADAWNDTCCLAASLLERGLEEGDRVAIISGNRSEMVIAALAVARAGGIFTLIHPEVRGQALLEIGAQLQPTWIFLEESTGTRSQAFPGARQGRFDERGVVIEGTRVVDRFDSNPPDFEPVSTKGSGADPVCLIYTSGSTGRPRGVLLSHDNLLFVMGAIQESLDYCSSDVIGLFLPLSFGYGFQQALLAARVGASVCLGRSDAGGIELLSRLEGQHVTVLPGVPTLFDGLVRLLDRRPRRLEALRILTNAGDNLPWPLLERLLAHFPGSSLFSMYGMTECTRISILEPGELMHRPDSVGQPLTGTEIAILDAEGQPLPPRKEGLIAVRGPHVALGYWNAPEESRARFAVDPETRARTLHTGDLGWVGDDGYLYVTGRADGLVKRRGFRIHTSEIEEAACRIPGVQQAVAILSSDRNSLHLFAVVKEPALSSERILETLRSELGAFKMPDEIHRLDAIPQTRNGKVDRSALAAILLGPADRSHQASENAL